MKVIVTSLMVMMALSVATAGNQPPSLPDHSSAWLGGNVLQWKNLKGKVVLMNVWTFGCWNSYRSLPWIVSLQQKFPRLQIIGVHSPEFDYEKNRDEMKKVMNQYNVTYPQVLDDNLAYWKSLNNRYWPSFYVVDKNGNLRGNFYGETHAGDPQSKRIESLIDELLEE